MKEIYDPLYHPRFIYFLHICKSSTNINNFILNQIVDTLMTILSTLKKTKFYSFGQEIFQYFTNEIIEREKLFSKPNPFKYKIDRRDELGND